MGLGTVLAPGTEHAMPRLFQECSPEEIPGAFGHCFRENVAPRVVFGMPGIPKWVQYRTFEARSELGPSKNGLREGFRKKHEK